MDKPPCAPLLPADPAVVFATKAGQDELFTTWRYHAVFTDSR